MDGKEETYEEMCDREDRETEQNERIYYHCNSTEGYDEEEE